MIESTNAWWKWSRSFRGVPCMFSYRLRYASVYWTTKNLCTSHLTNQNLTCGKCIKIINNWLKKYLFQSLNSSNSILNLLWISRTKQLATFLNFLLLIYILDLLIHSMFSIFSISKETVEHIICSLLNFQFCSWFFLFFLQNYSPGKLISSWGKRGLKGQASGFGDKKGLHFFNFLLLFSPKFWFLD